MNIKFLPQDPNWPDGKPVLTNVGEFRPGQILNMQPYQEKEAKRLIENGDFIEAMDAPPPGSKKRATPSPELLEAADEEGSSPVKKSSKNRDRGL